LKSSIVSAGSNAAIGSVPDRVVTDL